MMEKAERNKKNTFEAISQEPSKNKTYSSERMVRESMCRCEIVDSEALDVLREYFTVLLTSKALLDDLLRSF